VTITVPVRRGSRSVAAARLSLVLAVAAMSLLPLAVTGTNIAFAEIEATYAGTSRSTLSWALSGYSIVIAAFTLVGGQLSDRLAGRRVFLLGVVVFALASGLCTVAPNAAVFIAGRALQGVGGALVVPSSLIVATAATTPERRPFVIAVWTAAFSLGSSVAPVLTAVVLEFGSWRWVFGCMVAAALAVAVGALALPEPVANGASPVGMAVSARDVRRPDYLGVLMGTLAVGLLALGVVEGPVLGWTSARIVGVIGAALLLVPVFVFRSLRHPLPLFDLRLLNITSFGVACAANVFISMIGMAAWLLWPLLMRNEWGYSSIEIGLAITPTPVLGAVGAWVAARAAAQVGHRAVLVTGTALAALGNLWFVLALGPEPAYLTAMLPGLVLYGAGLGLTFAPINAVALSDVPIERYGQANAGFSTVRFLSGAIGIAAVVAAVGDDPDGLLPGLDRAFGLLGAVSVLTVVILLAWWPVRR
jgi:EmrB/QacA subfamily drug resistance transporter